MPSNIMTAVVRVACNNPDLLSHNRILEFAEQVEKTLAAMAPAVPADKDRVERDDDDEIPDPPNFYRDAVSTMLGGMIDEMSHLQRLVLIGPPFDRADLVGSLHTLSVNGEMCWAYLHRYVEASSCAGNA